MPRRAAKIDANQPAIVAEFERLGCAVKSTAGVADGFPDLIVHRNGHHLVEVKAPKGKLRGSQIRFMEQWPGIVHVVKSEIEARALVQQWDKEVGNG